MPDVVPIGEAFNISTAAIHALPWIPKNIDSSCVLDEVSPNDTSVGYGVAGFARDLVTGTFNGNPFHRFNLINLGAYVRPVITGIRFAKATNSRITP